MDDAEGAVDAKRRLNLDNSAAMSLRISVAPVAEVDVNAAWMAARLCGVVPEPRNAGKPYSVKEGLPSGECARTTGLDTVQVYSVLSRKVWMVEVKADEENTEGLWRTVAVGKTSCRCPGCLVDEAVAEDPEEDVSSLSAA